MDSTNARNSPIHESFSAKISDYITPQKQQAIREALDHLVVSEKYQNKKDVETSGTCKSCQTSTSHKCHKCDDYYCPSDCQEPNWKKHEAKCNNLPSSKVKSPTSNKSTETDEKLIISKNSSPFMKLTQQLKNTPVNGASTNKTSGRKSEPAMGKSLTKFKHHDGNQRQSHKRLTLSDTDSKPKERRSFGKNNHNKKFPAGSSSSAEIESVINSVSSRTTKSVAKAKEPTNQRTSHVKTNGVNVERRKTKRVIFFYKEPNTPIHWVMDEDDMKEFESIHNTLAKECDDYESIKPEVGLVCGCKYSDEWYRARVVALQPKLRVHYIDFGNSAEAPTSPLKKLPPEIKMVKNLVYSIEFDENTPEKYRMKDLSGKTLKIEVKRVTESDVEVVDLTPECYTLKSSDSEMTEDDTKELSTANMQSAMDWIQSDSKGVISFLPGGSKIRYGLIIPEGSEKETEIDVKQAKSLDSNDLHLVKSALEGDYVAVIDYDDERRRGKVVSTLSSTYYVLLIDYGIVIAVENVYHLPGRNNNLIHLGANVIINEILSFEKMRKVENALYQVTGEQDSEGRWPCELIETSSEEVIAKGYIQSPPEEGVTVPLFLPLEPGSIYEMSVVTGVKSCYVRPLHEQAARKSLEMSVKMAEFLVQTDLLTRPPEIGKMYAAKNRKDHCFHRAVVKSVKNDKFEVLFVDYGTVEKVGMRDLKPLPVSIKVVPFFAVEVTLSGITVDRLSDPAKKYLNTLIELNLTLVLNFSEGESDEVILREAKSGIIVNEVIENSESEKKDNDERDEKNDVNFNGKVKDENFKDRENGRRIMSSDQDEDVVMKSELKLPKIRTNTRYDLVLQYVEEHEFFSTLTFWMANTEDDTFSQVSNLVNSEIGKYCCEEREPYRPKENEMCLALYEGDWYRALTLSVKNDNYEIFFVDFGNTCILKPKAIRKMKREFMEHPAWAFKCIISGVGKLIGKPGLKKAVYEELKRRMNSIFKGVIVTKHEFEIYYVAIPEIEEILSA